MAKKWNVPRDDESKNSEARGTLNSIDGNRPQISYSALGTPYWPRKSKFNIILTICIIVLCVLIGAYFILKNDRRQKPYFVGGLVPPDVESPLPPSPSRYHIFKKGAVCTDGPPCSSIGRDILGKNGSAVDATIAAMICNGIVNMQSMGLGGGFLMTIYERETRKAYTLIARETAPLKATFDMYKDKPEGSKEGPLAIAVPGAVRGFWEAHKRFGKLSWMEVIEPSLQLCQTGYNMTKHQSDSIDMKKKIITEDPNLREMFYDENAKRLKHTNDLVFPCKTFCSTLKTIAEKGGDELYTGALSEVFIKDLQDAGSIITKKDLEDYTAIWEEPIQVALPDNDKLFSVPPPGSGALLGFLLNIIGGFNFTRDSIKDVNATVQTYHRILEAFKYTYAKRTHIGDQAFVDVKDLIKNLTSPSYANEIRMMINDNQTYNNASHYGAEFVYQPDHGTAHISVLAPNGDAVSVTSTINYYFGSGVMTKNTGIVMNNNMDDFSSPGIINGYGLPASPANFIQPGKRPMSSMSPTIIVNKNGDVKIVIGASGGTKITTSIALVVTRSLWFGQTVKQAVDAPRIHHQVFPMSIEYEYGNMKQVMDGLKGLGHETKRYDDRGSIICAVFKNATGIYANADYRKGGDVYGID